MRERILKVIGQVIQQPVQVEDDEQSLFETGVLDSFALPDLVSAIETEFSIAIPDSDLTPRKFESISRIESYLSEHAAK